LFVLSLKLLIGSW